MWKNFLTPTALAHPKVSTTINDLRVRQLNPPRHPASKVVISITECGEAALLIVSIMIAILPVVNAFSKASNPQVERNGKGCFRVSDEPVQLVCVVRRKIRVPVGMRPLQKRVVINHTSYEAECRGSECLGGVHPRLRIPTATPEQHVAF